MTVIAVITKGCGENAENFGQVSLYTHSACPMDLLS